VPYSMQSREISDAYFSPELPAGQPRALEITAAMVDEQARSEVDLSLTWRELVQRCSTVVSTFFSATRCGVVLAEAAPQAAPPLGGRRLEIIESVLSGMSQNRLAIELALAPSTVALNARLALEGLGVSSRPSRVHPLLMLSATAARNRSLVTGSLSFIQNGGRELRIVGIPRPDRRLVGVLPAAELAVVGCLLEGCCYTEIAQRRRTSERTIANQIAGAFRRLRVSGRSELLQRLFALEGAVRPVPPANPRQPSSAARPATLPPPSTVRYPRALHFPPLR